MNILVVDDEKMFRKSFSTALKIILANVRILEASSGAEALGVLHTDSLDFMILDVNMPGMNGLEVAEKTKKLYPKIKIVILTNVDGEAMILHLYNAGVDGFLFKNIEFDELTRCISQIQSGERYFIEPVKAILNANKDKLGELPEVSFSKREHDIYRLMKDGQTSKQISDILGIKEKTVTSYKEDMMKKTNTKNAAELISFGYKNSIGNG